MQDLELELFHESLQLVYYSVYVFGFMSLVTHPALHLRPYIPQRSPQ